MLVGILLVKPGDLKTCAILESKHKLREYFDTQFPMFAPYVSDEDLARMAKRRLSALPTFSHAGGESAHRVDTSLLASSDAQNTPKLELELGGACLLGDSIHTVKPYFGLGVNSALEDVCVLDACLDESRRGTRRATSRGRRRCRCFRRGARRTPRRWWTSAAASTVGS